MLPYTKKSCWGKISRKYVPSNAMTFELVSQVKNVERGQCRKKVGSDKIVLWTPSHLPCPALSPEEQLQWEH